MIWSKAREPVREEDEPEYDIARTFILGVCLPQCPLLHYTRGQPLLQVPVYVISLLQQVSKPLLIPPRRVFR